MKILIVDDLYDNRTLLAQILLPFGQCDMAVNGVEALQLVEEAFEKSDPYNLILLDIMMPIMEGQEALKKIREMERELGIEGAKETVIIMITALDMPNVVTEAFFKGYCTDFMDKPILRVKLLNKLKEYNLITDF